MRADHAHARRGAALACALALALASACARDSEPAWLDLARGFVPATEVGAGEPWRPSFLGGESLTLRPDEHGGGWWVVARVGADDWEPAGWPGTWKAKRPVWDVGMPAGPRRDPQRLASAEATYAFVPFSKGLVGGAELAPGSFCGVVEYVYLFTGGEARPPECTYEVYVDRGGVRDGTYRVALERFTSDGIPVWSGHAEALRADVPPRSALRFATAGMATAPVLGEAAGSVTFRVQLDGEELFAFEQEVADLVRSTWHAVPLPPAGARGAELRFEVEGRAAVCAFLTPTVGPAEVGTYGERPWGPAPPDVVLFLADTFRADNLAAYGGELGVTPELDRFAESALCFRRAWSPASWTLPSQSSMMTGLYPHQHGADRSKRALAGDAVTLAERLATAGYRCGAITDSLLVSQRFGFDQGFATFDEALRELDDTLAAVEAFLDADDGRPVFLFVQTYRTHSPYRASEETRVAYADVLDLGADWDELQGELARVARTWVPGEPVPEPVRDVVRRIRDLYLGGVVDLDRGFGRFLDAWRARGLDRTGYLVFTSDHGEAFGEHDRLYHGNGVWEANVRIPLLLAGGGLAGTVDEPASLVDLPRTIAELAGVEPAARWGGRSLVSTAGGGGARFSFECPADGDPGLAAAMVGARKLIVPSRPEAWTEQALEAYDLERDPAELDDATERGAAWPRELTRELADEAAALYRSLYEPETARLRPRDVQALEALGYVDFDD